jgi:dihydropteroate synthase
MLYDEGMVKLVGILNVTPDSFSDGGQYEKPDAAVRHAARLFKDGARWWTSARRAPGRVPNRLQQR